MIATTPATVSAALTAEGFSHKIHTVRPGVKVINVNLDCMTDRVFDLFAALTPFDGLTVEPSGMEGITRINF